MTEEKEIWKDVVGYEGLYEVSNLGRVKSLNYNHTGKPSLLKLITTKYGYLDVSLHKNGVTKSFKVHILVSLSFLDCLKSSNEVYVVDHINGIRSDPRAENLRFVTQRFNSSIGFRINADKYSSKYVGVSKRRSNGKWMATIYIKPKSVNLGYYFKEEDAAKAYQDALLKLKNVYDFHFKQIK